MVNIQMNSYILSDGKYVVRVGNSSRNTRACLVLELDKLVEVRPKTVEQLVNSNILSDVKVKTHGEEIIKNINS